MASSILKALHGDKPPSESLSLFKNNPFKRSENASAEAFPTVFLADDDAKGNGVNEKQKKKKIKGEPNSGAEVKDGGKSAKVMPVSGSSGEHIPPQPLKKSKKRKEAESSAVKENGQGTLIPKHVETEIADGGKKKAGKPPSAVVANGGKKAGKSENVQNAAVQRVVKVAAGLLKNGEGKRRKTGFESDEVVVEKQAGGKKKKLKNDDESADSKRRGASGGGGHANLVSEEEVIAEKRKGKSAGEGSSEVDPEGNVTEEERRTIFVGNLPKGLKQKAIAQLFVSFGEVESVRLRSIPISETKLPRKAAILTGQLSESRTSMNAYVVFKSEDAARAALVQNMKEVDGKHVRVDLATPRGGRSVSGQRGSVEYDRARSVFIGNLPFDVEEEELLEVMGAAEGLRGTIEAVRAVRDRNTNIGRGIAFILFRDKEAMRVALSLNGEAKLRGRDLRITRLSLSPPTRNESFARPKPRMLEGDQPENRMRAKKRPAVAERKAAMALLKSGVSHRPPLEKKKVKKSIAGAKGSKKKDGVKKGRRDSRRR